MTTPTNSHKAWTNKGGHVTAISYDRVAIDSNFFCYLDCFCSKAAALISCRSLFCLVGTGVSLSKAFSGQSHDSTNICRRSGVASGLRATRPSLDTW
jgi:hypothetical protein